MGNKVSSFLQTNIGGRVYSPLLRPSDNLDLLDKIRLSSLPLPFPSFSPLILRVEERQVVGGKG